MPPWDNEKTVLKEIVRSLQDLEESHEKLLLRLHHEHIDDLRRLAAIAEKLSPQNGIVALPSIASACSAVPLELSDLIIEEKQPGTTSFECMRQESSSHSTGWDDANRRAGLFLPENSFSQAQLDLRKMMEDGDTPEKETKSAHDTNFFERSRSLARLVMQMPGFESVLGVVILLNSLTIGIDIQNSLQEDSGHSLHSFIETIFLIIYIAELSIRFVARGTQIMFEPWIVFDIFLVSVGIFSTWILEPIFNEKGSLEEVLVLKVLRLARLLRALRICRRFDVIARLANGILNSSGAVVSTVGVLFFSLYMFACLGIEVITKDDALQSDRTLDYDLNEKFGSLFSTMLTLVQFVTMDSIAEFYMPLLARKPILSLYFIPIIVIVPITIMNLVTALIVEGALKQTQMDAEKERGEQRKVLKALIPSIRKAFEKLDKDQDRAVSLEEIGKLEFADFPQLVHDRLDVRNMQELFELLDEDQSGDVNEGEFIEGILNVFMRDTPIEIVKMLNLLRAQRRHNLEMNSMMEMTSASLKSLSTKFEELFPPPLAI
eukprot:TRINITY_DN68184_c0_g1_i1.p1 TRINITY_DN68184_c0_g1~~TRINITY_DN68184_c0_g1_i1.p1  ORF type:complete len:547 (-),score=84.66 TRINITY_DN68184_c0_g1_i1:470-2110(-)